MRKAQTHVACGKLRLPGELQRRGPVVPADHSLGLRASGFCGDDGHLAVGIVLFVSPLFPTGQVTLDWWVWIGGLDVM